MTGALAVDLGGTNIRAAVFPRAPLGPDAVPERRLHAAAPASLDRFVTAIRALLDETAVTALGIAIPGLVEGATCRWAPNLSWLDGVDLESLFPGVRVSVANDAQFSLLAEAAAGAARGTGNAILLAIGTGIGSGLMADGRIVRGVGGAAVSFGWACARHDEPGDLQHGWLERQASGRALDRAAARLGLASGAALVEAARAGNTDALAALEAAGEILGAALAGAVALAGTERIVIAGSVSAALDLIGPALLGKLHAHLPPHLRSVALTPGAFGAHAALCGAAFAAHQHPIWGTP